MTQTDLTLSKAQHLPACCMNLTKALRSPLCYGTLRKILSVTADGVKKMIRLARSTHRTVYCAGLVLSGLMLSTSSHAADIPLYPTGPSADSSFVRFINGTDAALELTAAGSKAKVQLDAKTPATAFYPVRAKSDIKGQFTQAQSKSDISTSVKAGEFVSVIALADGAKIKYITLGEEPDDFNALKVSLAFINVSTTCTNAGLQVVGRDVMLFEKLAVNGLSRRMINPVKISVQLRCGDQPTGAPLELGELIAGERYSVFAVPAVSTTRIFIASDAVAR
jgi:alginate O-acetyltransferase complex protein AlgF